MSATTPHPSPGGAPVGRVSYSLYLLHLPLLMILAVWIDGKLPFGLLLLPFLAILFALSAVFHRFVEAPSMDCASHGASAGASHPAAMFTVVKLTFAP